MPTFWHYYACTWALKRLHLGFSQYNAEFGIWVLFDAAACRSFHHFPAFLLKFFLNWTVLLFIKCFCFSQKTFSEIILPFNYTNLFFLESLLLT
jgi:hypothetical protein